MEVYEVGIRILLAMLLGGLLGIERGRRGKSAGFRTYVIVCVASSLIMVTNEYIYFTLHASDPVRMGAQVVSGIGFLGAGSIIVTGRHEIKGLTTAAALWASASIGLACGAGFYSGAVIGTVVILLSMHTLRILDKYIINKENSLILYMELAQIQNLTPIVEVFREWGIEIQDIKMGKAFTVEQANIGITMLLRLPDKLKKKDVLLRLLKSEGIIYLEEI